MLSDLKTFINIGCKIAAHKKFVCGLVLTYWADILVSVFLTPFNNIFALTSQSQMSKLLIFSEIVSDLKTFAQKGCNIAAAKNVFYNFFFYLFTSFKRLFVPTS